MPVWAQGLYTFLIAWTVPFYMLVGLGWMSPLGVFAMFQTSAILLMPLLYWNRAKYTLASLKRMAAFLLLMPTMLAGFGASFYYVLEVRRLNGRLAEALAAALGLAWIAGWVWAIVKVYPGGGFEAAEYPSFDREDYEREFQAAKQKVLAQLDAEPRLRKYKPQVEAYQIWSYEQAVYLEDPTLTAACPHLRPVEAAMRASGIGVNRAFRRMGEVNPQYFHANAIIDEKALRERFPLPGFIRYSEYCNEWEDRGPRSDARLVCEKCECTIGSHHPEDCAPGTPRFPS